LTENFHQAAKSTQEDVDAALDAAHEAFPTWSKTSATESNMLLKIAQVMEDNLEYLATLKPSITENQSANLVLLIFLFV
jgi:aldehyde dehydrogenase (NAD+)/aldehyde dehydrogenase